MLRHIHLATQKLKFQKIINKFFFSSETNLKGNRGLECRNCVMMCNEEDKNFNKCHLSFPSFPQESKVQ